MKKILTLVTCAVLISLLCVFAFAHKGNTDSNGGHYNRTTGEYHYHHGFPEHQHINGECPYDFDDKTNHSVGTGTFSKSSVETQKTSFWENILQTLIPVGILALCVFLLFVPVWIKNLKGIVLKRISQKTQSWILKISKSIIFLISVLGIVLFFFNPLTTLILYFAVIALTVVMYCFGEDETKIGFEFINKLFIAIVAYVVCSILNTNPFLGTAFALCVAEVSLPLISYIKLWIQFRKK